MLKKKKKCRDGQKGSMEYWEFLSIGPLRVHLCMHGLYCYFLFNVKWMCDSSEVGCARGDWTELSWHKSTRVKAGSYVVLCLAVRRFRVAEIELLISGEGWLFKGKKKRHVAATKSECLVRIYGMNELGYEWKSAGS